LCCAARGGRWLCEQYGHPSLPLMVRPNTVLPVGANEDRPDYEYADGVTFHVFELADASSADEASAEKAPASAGVPAPDGSVAMTVPVRREGHRIDVQVQGAFPTGGRPSWSVLLRGVSDGTSAGVASVEGGAAPAEALGTRLGPAEGVRRLVVHL
jgi:alpha-D-xyloside xylohydrolase